MGRKKNKYSKNTSNNENKNNQKTLLEKAGSLNTGGTETESDKKLNVHGFNDKTNTPVVKNTVGNAVDEISFVKYHRNAQRVAGREYYVHSLCQVCKEEPQERVLCPKCHLITYCSQSHRREHWSTHADLCDAILRICNERQVNHIMQGIKNCSAEKFRIFRFQNMVECEIKVERPLEKWEREMFIFPNVCELCHEYNTNSLTVCSNCHHSSFCEGHQTVSHSEWCEHLLLYKSIVKEQARFGVVFPTIPNCKISSVFPKLVNTKDVFKGILNVIDELEFLELTEITTYPLTTLNALLTMNREGLIDFTKLTLHVVGAEPDFETNKLEKWEYYILHLIPELRSLEIVFVGPELNTANKPGAFKVCNQCLSVKKSISFKFHNQLYHTFSDSPSFSKPNLICVFNPGLYRVTGFGGADTWSPTIVSMFAKNCPVLVTAYTHKEILLDVKRVKSTQNVCLEIEPSLNPFFSSKPSLNFVSDEDSPVIFKNQYYCIMCKL